MELRTIIDDRQFTELIKDARANAKNLRPAMLLVGQFVCESIDETFAAEGRPESWAALADSTLAQKKPGLNILEGETKRLREGIHVESTGRDYVDVAPDDLPYARIQHLGGDTGRGGKTHIKARHYMGIQSRDADRIAEIIADHIVGGL